jgi:hypothetical protein
MIHAGVIHVGIMIQDGLDIKDGIIITTGIDITQHGTIGIEELLEIGEINGLTDTMLMVSID